MGLSEKEQSRLAKFGNLKLDRIQTETIIRRDLTNAEWKSLNKDYHKIFTPIARQAANTALKRQRLKSSENKFKIIAHEAAKVGARKQAKAAKEPDDNFHLVKSLFRES